MAPKIDITLDMCIEELQRRKLYFEVQYPKLVEACKITPYQRDAAINANKKLLSLLNTAKRNKNTNGKTFIQLIDEIPVAYDQSTGEMTIDMLIEELNVQAMYCKKRMRQKINSKLLTLLSNSKVKRSS